MEGKNLSQLPREGEEIEVTIDLGALQEALQELQDGEEVEINLGEATDAGSFAGEEAEEDEDKDDEKTKWCMLLPEAFMQIIECSRLSIKAQESLERYGVSLILH